jgi:hypothetical protein
MRRVLIAVSLSLLCLAPLGRSAPVDGTSWAEKRVEASSVAGPGVLSFDLTFVAGERACVIVIGDHKPVVEVEVKVYDAKKQLVAHDRGQAPAADFVAVMWYPPRQESYRIDVINHGKEYNECSIAIK